MKLHDNPASPFCRKVRVLAKEAGLDDQIEIAYAIGSPVASDKMPVARNPLGKIPTLEISDTQSLYDSRVICRYLDAKAGGGFYPEARLFDVMTTEALADGVMDAAVLMVYEFRCREEGERSEPWVEAQWVKITRALDTLEAQDFGPDFDIGQIAIACALGYIDFRHDARDWRRSRPKLAAWFKSVSERSSMQQTVPSA